MRVALAGLAFVAVCSGAYAAALETSVFAVRRIVVVGGTPGLQQEVRAALAPDLGRSLLRVRWSDVQHRVAPIPDLLSITYDRQFPNTLHVRVTAERPVMLLRRGSDTWLVSARGRVLRQLRSPRRSSLPRIWMPKSTKVTVGETLPPVDGRLAAAALAPIARGTFPASVRFVRETSSELTLVLGSGLEIRLGDLGDLQLKLAIARRILHTVGAGPTTAGYLDVSVPERPVINRR